MKYIALILLSLTSHIVIADDNQSFSKDDIDAISQEEKAWLASYYNGSTGNPSVLIHNNVTESLKYHCTGYLSAAITGLNLADKEYIVSESNNSTLKVEVKGDYKMICNYTHDYKLFSAHYKNIQLYKNVVLIKEISSSNPAD